MSEISSRQNQAARASSSRRAYVSPSMTVRTDTRAKSMTEGGYSEAQARAVLEWERRNRRFKTENLAVIGEDGTVNPLGNPVIRRTRTSVTTDNRLIPDNAIVTHNHPWGKEEEAGTGLGRRVGVSLSGADIVNAIASNNKAKRAVTDNYVFSINRPANGWPRDIFDANASRMERHRRISATVGADWNRVYNRESKDMIDDIRRRRRSGELTREELNERWGRMNALAAHRATQYVARKYGFTYTRRRTT